MRRFSSMLISGFLAATAVAQQTAVDPHAEVAAALFAASATQTALAKTVDARLKAQQDHIAQLAAELKAGDNRHRAEMTSAQESFVADLAAKDREYAVQIAVFRTTVSDIAATPDGAQALERFNSGDEVGALLILDKLRASNEKMRAEKLRLEDAADARRIARLALEARSRGKVNIDTVIVRFEEVVKLDPGEPEDWRDLKSMYAEAGKLPQARKAADAMAVAARNDRERADALDELADVLKDQGDMIGARRAAEEALKLSQKLLAQSPVDRDVEFNYAKALLTFGEMAARQGDLGAADAAYSELVTLMRRRSAAPSGTAQDRNALSSDLLHLASELIQRGETRKARAAIEETIALNRQLLAELPDNIKYERQLGIGLFWLNDVLVALGEYAEARRAEEETIAINTRLAALEPTNPTPRGLLGLAYIKAGVLSAIEGHFEESATSFEHARVIFHELASAPGAALNDRVNEGSALQGLSDARFQLRDMAAARRYGSETVALYRDVAATDATDIISHLFLAQALYNLSQPLIADRDFKAARQAIDEGLAIDRGLAKRASNKSDVQYDLSTGQLAAGDLLRAEGRHKEALVQLRQSLATRQRLAAAQPGSASLSHGIGEVMRSLVETPGSSLSWTDFANYLNACKSQNVLQPADEVWLQEAREHGAS